MVDRDGSLERSPGHVLTETGWKQLAEGDASHDDQHQGRGRGCGVSDEAAETDPDDGDEADRQGAEDHRPEDAGMSEGHLEVLGGEDPLSELRS